MLARTALSTVLCVAGLLVPVVVSAQRSATDHLRARHEEVTRVLGQAANDDAARQRRSERVTRALNELLDYEELSRRALRDHWEGRTPEQRSRFVELLRRLVERNYEGNLERIVDFEITYGSETARGDVTVVQTTARSRTQRRQPPVQIDYSLVRRGDGWKVVDVATDGVSMVDNYRAQFNRIITRDGWDELLMRMQRRLESGEDT